MSGGCRNGSIASNVGEQAQVLGAVRLGSLAADSAAGPVGRLGRWAGTTAVAEAPGSFETKQGCGTSTVSREGHPLIIRDPIDPHRAGSMGSRLCDKGGIMPRRSGSVGALGEQSPGATRPFPFLASLQSLARGRTSRGRRSHPGNTRKSRGFVTSEPPSRWQNRSSLHPSQPSCRNTWPNRSGGLLLQDDPARFSRFSFRFRTGAIRKNRCLGAGFLFSHTPVDIPYAAMSETSSNC